jgi:hypothetical protein
MAPKPKLQKNIAGFTDHNGFHPVRSGNTPEGNFLPGYSPDIAGDNDDVFDKEIRRERNIKKAQIRDEQRQMDDALEAALGEEKKISLSQFVRREGGIRFDEKSTANAERGELRRLSFKESKVRGIVHKNGKNTLDGMREAADLAGYAGKNGEVLSSIDDFLQALEADLKGKKKIYPFGTIGTYKHNPKQTKAQYWTKYAANLHRLEKKLRKRKFIAKANKLERVRQKALAIAQEAREAEKMKTNPAKSTKAKTVKKAVKKVVKKTAKTSKPKKNGLLETAATLAVGASAALNVFDRFKTKKPTGAANGAEEILKDNKGADAAHHEAQFELLLEEIEAGDFKKIPKARMHGKLAGYGAGEMRHLIGSAELTGGWRNYSAAKNKKNPAAELVKQTDEFLLKENGIVRRTWARHKATNAYRRQLKLEAALDRAKGKRAGYEKRARKNPAGSKAFEEFHGRPSTKILQLEVPEGAPKKPWTIGRLLEIRLKRIPRTTPGDFPKVLDFRKETTGSDFLLVADEGKKQMWIAGKKIKIYAPDSEIKKGHSIDCAEITHVIYEAEKHHLGDVAPQGYIHKLGWETYQFREDRGLPALAFDRDGCAIIRGGVYTITPLGIAD